VAALRARDPRLRAARPFVRLRNSEPGEHSLEGPRRAQRSEHDGRTHATPTTGEHPPTPDETRLIRRDPDTVRHFVSDLYQRALDPQTGDTQEETFRLYAGDREIAEIVRQSGTDQTLYFHTDELGTVDTISTVSGPAVHQTFDDFGAPLDSASTLTRAGYTGHQHDTDLGLIDMRGRVYDTLAGRFTTADPIAVEPFWSQGLNRYAYVFNDPANVVDPSGFWEIAAGNAGGAYLYGGFSGLDALGLGASALSIGVGIATLPGSTPSSTHTGPAGVAAAKNTQATTAGSKATDLNNGQVEPPVGEGDSLSRWEPSPRCKANPNAIGCGFDPLYALDFVPVPLGAVEKTGAWTLEKLLGRLFGKLFGKAASRVTAELSGRLLRSATEPFAETALTQAGRALTKHPEILGLTKETLRKALRTDAALNDAAKRAVSGLLENGKAAVKEIPRFGKVIEVQGAEGFGARWYEETGKFIGFIGPPG